MPCYEIEFRDRFGTHFSHKWGKDIDDALACLKKTHSGKRRRGLVEYGIPKILKLQPFSDEAREISKKSWDKRFYRYKIPETKIELFEKEEETYDITNEHETI